MANSIDLTTFPTARDDATEDKWTKYASALITNGVLHGVMDEYEVFADSTGMVVKVRSGRGYVDGFCSDTPSQQTLDIAAADPTNPRLDRVVLRLTTTSPATIAMKVITGSPAGSPVAPALLDDATHTDIGLATVRVEALAGTIAAGKVTDTRLYVQPGYSVLGRTEFRGDTAAPAHYSSDGTLQGLIGLRSDVTPNDDDLVMYSYTGDLVFAAGGTASVIMRANSTDVSISVLQGDIDMVDGILRFDTPSTTSTATAGGGTLPANPTGFLKVLISGIEKKIPYYNS